MAKNSLEAMQKGFDSDDGNLTSEELSGKYKGDVLGTKAKNFNKLPIDAQKEVLYTSVSGKETKISKDIKESPMNVLVVQRAKLLLVNLRKIKKLDAWEKACSFQIFKKLSLEEKVKYYNKLVKYHDKHMKGESVPKRVLDSSPTVGAGFPDFDDPTKWAKK